MYEPSGYEPFASTFTYGPAKAAPAKRNGDAAIAAIVDLIVMFKFKCLARILKNPADDSFPDMGNLIHQHRVRSFGPDLFV